MVQFTWPLITGVRMFCWNIDIDKRINYHSFRVVIFNASSQDMEVMVTWKIVDKSVYNIMGKEGNNVINFWYKLLWMYYVERISLLWKCHYLPVQLFAVDKNWKVEVKSLSTHGSVCQSLCLAIIILSIFIQYLNQMCLIVT